MARLEDLIRGAAIRGILPDGPVTVVDALWHGNTVVELTYKDVAGRIGQELLYRDREPSLEVVEGSQKWSFDADGGLLRLVSEAYRIRLAYLFDPLVAVHASLVDPLPHQITAVYEEMLPRQPLRYLLADDPGAGKTIMAGLLIKELLIRGDLQRCLIVCPGSLVEQWQDELLRRFSLPFAIMTNEGLESARTGNWLAETPLVIARLDKLARDEDLQDKLRATDWDLIVCDEAHKMSASYFASEVRYTKRYHLGRLLSGITRHFLLMSATPHNGKEEDFQLFMSLIDADRFEGKYRRDTHASDTSDLMRRMVKEQLLKFDGTPLFPERRAYTVNYTLSDDEAALYEEVTNYVREEFNRADQLANDGRKGTVGFALMALQRRLASSPAAIYQSLRRRRERLEGRLREEQLMKRGAELAPALLAGLRVMSADDLDDLDDAPDAEIEATEEELIDSASAAQTIRELEIELDILRRLEALAERVRRSRQDRKWEELSSLLQDRAEMFDAHGHRRKLVIFTEHRDTLNYLVERISTLIGREAIVTIHGALPREERRKAQEAFTQDKDVVVLVATDAAGEGINLQRAHLMVNYDLPWNPNRLEQRFGRIHRIGQTEVCHLWNLVANETREGDVYFRLLKKIEAEREALGGQVFDVLGKVTFDNRPLRELLTEAIRYGDQPEVRARLERAVDNALDRKRLSDLIEERALDRDSMDVSKVQQIREDMERAEARRLQPHYICSFFLEAFRLLGGTIREREAGRYEITNVPAAIRSRDREIGAGQHVLHRYERMTFEKSLIAVPGKPLAELIAPGHPLLDATIDLILERYRTLLKQGAILVDPVDDGDQPRALFYLEHAIQDARVNRHGDRTVVSRQLQFVEIDGMGTTHSGGGAPYLDYRPLRDDERTLLEPALDAGWLGGDLERAALGWAVTDLTPAHVADVRQRTEKRVRKTEAAVHERLTKEINYWDNRAEQLRQQEQAGKAMRGNLNSALAARRRDELIARLGKRTAELKQERQIIPQPPAVIGGALVVPAGLLARLGSATPEPAVDAVARRRVELLAMEAVVAAERALGNEPRDVSADNLGYDIESRAPEAGRLRFIEVKGRATGAPSVTVTRNEILRGMNMPDEFILAIVEVDGVARSPRYVRQPFRAEPDFGVTSVTYALRDLLARSEAPG